MCLKIARAYCICMMIIITNEKSEKMPSTYTPITIDNDVVCFVTYAWYFSFTLAFAVSFVCKHIAKNHKNWASVSCKTAKRFSPFKWNVQCAKIYFEWYAKQKYRMLFNVTYYVVNIFVIVDRWANAWRMKHDVL